MKKFLLLCMMLCLSIFNGLAQDFDESKLRNLTDEFIQKANSSEALSILTNVKAFYGSLSVDNKKKARIYYVNEISTCLEKEQKGEALAIIYLYQNITEVNDERLPTLLYIKGNIFAEKVDSLHLKQTIEELGNLKTEDSCSIQSYIIQLNKKLENLRNFVPPYQKVAGTWIADDLCWNTSNSDHYLVGNFTKMEPDIILNINYDQLADTASWRIDKECFLTSQVIAQNKLIIWTWDLKEYASQLIIPYSSDSIYVLWSSEKIKENGITHSSILRGTVGMTFAMINAELAQNNKHDFSEQLLGSMATTVAEIGINSLIDALFTPSKKMFVLEARLKIVNEYLMRGTLIYKYSKVKADGISKYHEYHTNISLVRWLPESKIAFIGQPNNGFGPLPHPSWNISPKKYKENKTTRFSYYFNKIYKKTLRPSNAVRTFNIDQIKGLMIYNDSLLKAKNYHGEYAIRNIDIPFWGFEYAEVDQKTIVKKGLQNTGYIYITNIHNGSPAFIAGLKKGDIILKINNILISNNDEMSAFMQDKKIGDWVSLNVLRGGKKIDLLLRVTWI